MQARFVALALGILFLLLGLAGFVPALMLIPGGATPDAPISVPNLTFSDGYGYLLGLFPTNYLYEFNLLAAAIAAYFGFFKPTDPVETGTSSVG